jgi:ATP-dependent Clp protease ATP-binding subunit ClpC
MTSNTGFNLGATVGFQETTRDVQAPLKSIFNPEFLDRLDEVISFETFDEHSLLYIANGMLDETRDELFSRDIDVSFSSEVASFLLAKLPKGESARPLRAVMREYIEDPLSLELLTNGSEEPLMVTVEAGKIIFARPVPVV